MTTPVAALAPTDGASWEAIETRMRAMAAGDVKWRDGRAAVYVFNAGEDVGRVKRAAYALFSEENGLGPGAFPSLARMEREVVDFGLALLNAPEGAAGSMTSGGTESIFLALKAARDAARVAGKKGPLNIVLPRSAHPAFDKACAVMDIAVRRTPLRDYLADPVAMDAAIDDATMLIAGSAPCFPYGLIDPIADLGALAARRGVWLHVDACVGGYIAPFVRMNGVDLPAFDFAAPAVQSISADLHKYGYAAKGASTVFFRTEAQRALAGFDLDVWPAGRTRTPTMAGTRPGGAIAAAWAVIQFLGVNGYREKQKLVIATRARIGAGVQAQGYEIIGAPQLGILAFTRRDVAPLAVLKEMYGRGWVSSALTEPEGLHLMLSPVHAEVADTYLADLAAATEAVRGSDGVRAPAEYGG
jgi:glutamate/tyrosine decarboxylase-like PLP-dependent enzyme